MRFVSTGEGGHHSTLSRPITFERLAVSLSFVYFVSILYSSTKFVDHVFHKREREQYERGEEETREKKKLAPIRRRGAAMPNDAWSISRSLVVVVEYSAPPPPAAAAAIPGRANWAWNAFSLAWEISFVASQHARCCETSDKSLHLLLMLVFIYIRIRGTHMWIWIFIVFFLFSLCFSLRVKNNFNKMLFDKNCIYYVLTYLQ